jgi:DNA replication and repair protein RecF
LLANIEVRGFRNLSPQSWAPGGGHHLLLGTNGAGKTSLLEAVYMLATTRSFRTSQLADCCQRDATAFSLHGVVTGVRRTELALRWHRGSGSARERLVDGNTSSLAEHLEVLPILAWTAADSELLTGPPAIRRRLLDRGIVARKPAAISVLARYRRALAAKKKLLLNGVSPRSAELATWNELLASESVALTQARADYADQLTEALHRVLGACEIDLPPLELAYRPSLTKALESVEAASHQLAEVALRECAAQRALIGPHRDDLRVSWQGRIVRRMASAGERKALGLLLLAAQIKVLTDTGRAPVVLVDDADAELDHLRLRGVWEAFTNVKQLFASSNRPEVWREIRFDHQWLADAGAVIAQAP